MSDLNSVIRSGIKSGECTSKFATDLCDVLNSIGLYTSPYPIAPEAPVALRSKFIRMLQACVDKRLNVSASGIKTYSYVVSYENNGTTFLVTYNLGTMGTHDTMTVTLAELFGVEL